MHLPRASLLLAVALALGCSCVSPQGGDLGGELKVGILGMGNDSWPFSFPATGPTEPQNSGFEGFEIALMNAVCERANLSCTAVPLPSLEDRLAGLASGTLDILIASLSYTPGREAVVHFVKPFYYSSGVALFSDTSRAGLRLFGPGTKPDVETAPDGWRGVFTGNFPVGQTLCFVRGYYALPFVLEDLDVNVNISPTLQAAASKVRGGDCAALAYDSVTPQSQVGLPMVNAPEAYVSPYGIAISKQAAGSELEQRLVYALTGVMNNGNASTILQLEHEWLVRNGVGPSRSLDRVVQAISSFGEPLAAGPGNVPENYVLFGTRTGGRKLLGGGDRRN